MVSFGVADSLRSGPTGGIRLSDFQSQLWLFGGLGEARLASPGGSLAGRLGAGSTEPIAANSKVPKGPFATSIILWRSPWANSDEIPEMLPFRNQTWLAGKSTINEGFNVKIIYKW